MMRTRNSFVARHEVQESFRVGGRIEKRLVDVGDYAKEGQVLATLDEKDLRLSMESAEAELRAVRAYINARLGEEPTVAVLQDKLPEAKPEPVEAEPEVTTEAVNDAPPAPARC